MCFGVLLCFICVISCVNLVVVMCVIDNFGFSIIVVDFVGVVCCCLSIDDIEFIV